MRSMRQIQLAHLNDKYFKGNAVYAPWGLSPCVTSAAGCGGGAQASCSRNQKDRMRRVIPNVDGRISNAIVSSYGMGGGRSEEPDKRVSPEEALHSCN